MRFLSPFAAIVLLAPVLAEEDSTNQPEQEIRPAQEIRYRSSGDDSMQPAFFWSPESDESVPLLVALHTWSSSYQSKEPKYIEWCQRAGWAYIYPNFRGPNRTPQAMGSDLVVADIVSAVRHAKSVTKIDGNRIYCVGVSGGGHAAMLVAARAPEIWAGVSAWCGISDIAAWHRQCDETKFSKYAKDVELALGGRPDTSDERLSDAKHRSPVTWLARAESLPPFDINHGIEDGRKGSVPFLHSLHAWNAAVSDEAKVSNDEMKQFFETQTIPTELTGKNIAETDDLYGTNQPIFRMVDENIRVTIFKGGHEIVHGAALNWLAAQTKNRPANWQPAERHKLETNDKDQQSGK